MSATPVQIVDQQTKALVDAMLDTEIAPAKLIGIEAVWGPARHRRRPASDRFGGAHRPGPSALALELGLEEATFSSSPTDAWGSSARGRCRAS